MLSLDLPWPPSVNHYWIMTVRGKRPVKILGAKGREFREKVQQIVGDRPPFEGRLAVSISASPPDRRKRDLDNLLKATFDAMEHAGVYIDDSQIDSIIIDRGPVVKGGHLKVRLSDLEKS